MKKYIPYHFCMFNFKIHGKRQKLKKKQNANKGYKNILKICKTSNNNKKRNNFLKTCKKGQGVYIIISGIFCIPNTLLVIT